MTKRLEINNILAFVNDRLAHPANIANRKIEQADEQAKLEMARLRNEGKAVALAPETIQGHGAVLLMIRRMVAICFLTSAKMKQANYGESLSRAENRRS